MRVFVTGATGFIGSKVVKELQDAGHKVLGMARSDEGGRALAAAGAEVHRGDLQDLGSLRSGAAQTDAVIHTAFIHDFSKFKENCEIEGRALEALGEELAGSNRLLIVTSGVALLAPGRMATEEDAAPEVSATYPRESEALAKKLAGRGVRVAVVRLPQVHDTVKQGLVTYAIHLAREKGVAAYVGEGLNRWPAAPLLATARLYRLALEKGEGDVRYHAVAEEGVRAKDIAQAIGRGLNVPVVSIAPEEAAGHFGWLGGFVSWDMPASSAITRKKLGWNPTGPDLLTDLANMRYS